MFPAPEVSGVTKAQGEKPRAAWGKESGLSYCPELSAGGSILHINIQYQEYKSEKKGSATEAFSYRMGVGLLCLWSFELSVLMWCDFRKEKDANYSGSACLRFRLHPSKTEIRQRGNRHLGIKCSQMRFDESQLPHRENGNTPLYGSPQWYIHARGYTHSKNAVKHSRELTFPDNDFEITFLIQ